MTETDVLVHSEKSGPEKGGELLPLTRDQAGWEWMSFFVRRLLPGDAYQTTTGDEEAAFVVLGGNCRVDWGEGPVSIGKRIDVFDGFPYAVYLPSNRNVSFLADTTCESAECRVPSTA